MGGWGGGWNANKMERQRKRKSRGEGNDEQRERLVFKKVCFSYKKDPPIALDFDHRQFSLKPDCCAGGCRQESSLCVCMCVVVFFYFSILWL